MSQVFCPHWKKYKKVLAPGQLSFIQLHLPPLLYFFCNLPYLSGRFNILRIMTTTVCVIKAPIPRQFIMCVEAARLKNTIWVNSVFAVLSVFNLVSHPDGVNGAMPPYQGPYLVTMSPQSINVHVITLISPSPNHNLGEYSATPCQ